MAKKTIDDIKVSGKKVLVRCDFNVPMKDGKITNDKRIVAALPTIKKLIADGGKVILCSHLGKPKNGPEEKFSLAPVAVRLSELLGQPVVFANDDTVVGDNAKAAVAAMKDGDVVLLQNTRFRKEETKNVEDWYSAVLNVGLGVFNLIPIPPLDGSHVLGELSGKAAELYNRYGRYWNLVLILLLVSGVLSRPLTIIDNAVLSGMQTVIFNLLSLLVHTGNAMSGVL